MIQNMQRFNEIRQIAQNPAESAHVQALVTVITELESRQLDAVESLHDALDVDGIERTNGPEERKEQLLDVVDAMTSGEFDKWWFETVAAEHLDNPEDARTYAGLTAEEWGDQIGRWASTYREKAPEEFTDMTDREVAEQHVYRKFGVSLSEFEREVVGYTREEALRTVVAGNFEAVQQGIERATAAAETGAEE